MDWKAKEARTRRAANVARLEAKMIVVGKNPRTPENTQTLALVYRSDQAIPEATFKRWRRTDEAQRLVEEAIVNLLDEKGITPVYFIDQLKRVRSELTTDAGKIAWIDRVARLLQIPI